MKQSLVSSMRTPSYDNQQRIWDAEHLQPQVLPRMDAKAKDAPAVAPVEPLEKN